MRTIKYVVFAMLLLFVLSACTNDQLPAVQAADEVVKVEDVGKVKTNEKVPAETNQTRKVGDEQRLKERNAISTGEQPVVLYEDESFKKQIGTLSSGNNYLVKEELLDAYSIRIENHLGYVKKEEVIDVKVEEIENVEDKVILHIATSRDTSAYTGKDKKEVYYTFEENRRIPVYGEEEGFYIVKVAKRLVYIERDRVSEDKGIPVLMYHHLLKNEENSNPSNGMVVPAENFAEQMDYLAVEGYETISLDDLYAYLQGKKNLSTNVLAITFDDGLKSNYIYAYPILKKHGFVATNFIITSRFNDTPSAFNPETLQFISKPEGAEMKGVFNLEGHTHRLHAVKEGKAMLVSNSKDFIRQDLTESKKILPQNFFAYPFGAYDEQAISILKELDYKMAVTTKPGRVQKGDNLFELKRIGIGPGHTIEKFKKAVEK